MSSRFPNPDTLSFLLSSSAFLLRLQTMIIMIIISLLISPAIFAAGMNIDVPTRSEVLSQLDALSKQKILSPAEKLSQQDLTKTLEYLDTIERTKQEAAQLKQQLTQAPAKLRQATEGLDALKNSSADTLTRESLSNYSLRQLESRLNETLDDLQSAQEDLSAYNSQLISLQTQPERVQSAMYNASMRLMQIRNQLNGLAPNQEVLRPTQQQALLTEQVMLNAQLDLQRKNLEANTTLQDLLQKQRDYTTAHINQLERYVQLLQEVVSGKRLILSEKTAKEAQVPSDATDIQNDPLVSRELAINKELSQRLINATKEGNTLVQQNIRVKNWLDRALQSERNLKEQITVLRGSLLLSRILYQQQLNLPASGLITNMGPRIADLRLEQFEINQQRDQLFQGDDYIQTLMTDSKEKVSPDVEDALGQIVDIRRELLDQLNKQLGNQLTLAINLQINQQQLLSVNESLQHTLTQQIFWVSSNKPMDWSWLKALPGEQ